MLYYVISYYISRSTPPRTSRCRWHQPHNDDDNSDDDDDDYDNINSVNTIHTTLIY